MPTLTAYTIAATGPFTAVFKDADTRGAFISWAVAYASEKRLQLRHEYRSGATGTTVDISGLNEAQSNIVACAALAYGATIHDKKTGRSTS